jgi:hypothetical protein
VERWPGVAAQEPVANRSTLAVRGFESRPLLLLEGSPSLVYGAAPETRLGSVPREFESHTLRPSGVTARSEGEDAAPRGAAVNAADF